MSPSGKRHIMHFTLSPEAYLALKALCDRPIARIPMSTMIEHLIREAAGDHPGSMPPSRPRVEPGRG